MLPIALTAQDKTDLVEFLKTLSGEPLGAGLVVDTSK